MPFCGQCGRELQLGEICSCQQPSVPGANMVTAKQTTWQTADKPVTSTVINGKKKKGFQVVLIAIILIAVAGIAVMAVGGGSYKAPLKKYAKLYNGKCTYPELFEIFYPAGRDYCKTAYSILKDTDIFRGSRLSMYHHYGDNVAWDHTQMAKRGQRLKVEIGNAKEIKHSELRDIQQRIRSERDYEDLIDKIDSLDRYDYENIADRYGISVANAKKLAKSERSFYKALLHADVSAGYNVSVRINSSQKVTARMLKINGKWVIYDFQDDGNIMRNSLGSVYTYAAILRYEFSVIK